MALKWLEPSPELRDESAGARSFFAVATALVALAMFVAAMGEGSPDTPAADRLPAWVDTAANVASAGLGVLVLYPKTRVVGCLCTAVMMVVAAGVNYQVDGPDFFLKALPFNVITAVLALAVVWRHRQPAS